MKENKITGIYKVTNIITGEFYIGSSKNIKQRWVSHKNPSFRAQHPNVKLYKGMAQYGLNNFTFEIIEETDNLKEREQYYIEQLKPTYNDRQANGYNAERLKESMRRASRKYYKVHQVERLSYKKEYNKTHHAENLTRMKAWCNKLCLYEGETITLHALSCRFRRLGIISPTQEAKKYLIENNDAN